MNDEIYCNTCGKLISENEDAFQDGLCDECAEVEKMQEDEEE